MLDPGALTTVQDGGRPGRAEIGLPPSGALDQRSMRLANRLVGNPDDGAVLETTLVGPTLRFERAATIAATGADTRLTLDERPIGMNAPCHVETGQQLVLGESVDGAHCYLAVRGGISVAPVLSSRSTDLLTGIGPPPLKSGDRVPVGVSSLPRPPVDVAPVGALAKEPEVRVILGPRADCFTDAAVKQLLTCRFRVGSDVNRIGARLEGPALERRDQAELLSEGLVWGSLQVPPAGLPILLLADHPTTGGYPVIATVVSEDRPITGQLRPGQSLRFRAVEGSSAVGR